MHLLVLRFGADADFLVDQPFDQLRVRRAGHFEGPAAAQDAFDLLALDDDFPDVAAIHLADEFGIGHLARGVPVRAALEHVEQGDQQHADHQPHGEISAEIVHEATPFGD